MPSLSTPVADVRDFGAKPSLDFDSTVAIVEAFTKERCVQFPPLDFAMAGTVNLFGSHVVLSPGATIQRIGSSTDPLFRLCRNFASVRGRGILINRNESPNGIIQVGPDDQQKAVNINWAQVSDVILEGPDKPGSKSVGLSLVNSAATGLGGSNYNGQFSNIVFRMVDIGVDVNPICNGHSFTDCCFYKVGSYSYRFRGATQSNVKGGFTHLCKTMKAMIRAEGCGYIMFQDVLGEPGSGVYFDFDENCKAMKVVGHNNTGKGYSDKGQNTTHFSHGMWYCNEVHCKELHETG